MPGLFGIIAKREGVAERDLLGLGRRMADSMRRRPWLRAEIWGSPAFCGGRVHLGVLNPLPQPLMARDSVIRVWFDGEFYPSSETRGVTPTADQVMELLRGSGTGLVEMDGVFALASFNEEGGDLVLANDRLGFRPLYYTETRDWFAYAAEVKALLAIRDRLPGLDEISLRQFFSFDHMLGDRTWWEGIESLPPGTVCRVSAKGRASRQYWTFDHIRRERRAPADVAVEFGRLWSQDVRRHSRPGTMPLLLSGGQDSRLLLAELLDQGADLIALTFGGAKSPEVKPARQAAAAGRIRHKVCDMNTGNWWRHRDEAIWQSDGLLNGINFHVAIAMEEMHTGNWYSPLNIAGDLLFGGSHLDRNFVAGWPRSRTDLMAPRYLENPFFDRDEVLAVSVSDIERYRDGPSSDCFHFRQRLRRCSLQGPSSLSGYCETVFPGVSRALLNLMLGSLSDEDRMDHKFYNKWLVTRHPKYYADIPWQATGRGLAESLPTRLRRGLRARVHQLSGREHKSVAPDEWFVNYPACVRQSRVRERLLGEDLIGDHFLGGAAKRALANHERAPLSAGTLVAILTFETYLRQVAGMPADWSDSIPLYSANPAPV